MTPLTGRSKFIRRINLLSYGQARLVLNRVQDTFTAHTTRGTFHRSKGFKKTTAVSKGGGGTPRWL